MTSARISSALNAPPNGGMPVAGCPSWILFAMLASSLPCFHSSSTRLGPWAPDSFGPWQFAHELAYIRSTSRLREGDRCIAADPTATDERTRSAMVLTRFTTLIILPAPDVACGGAALWGGSLPRVLVCRPGAKPETMANAALRTGPSRRSHRPRPPEGLGSRARGGVLP